MGDKQFFDAACVDFTPFAQVLEVEDKKQGKKVPLTYIPTARVIAAAGRPRQEVVRFAGGLPVRRIFGGGVVAVETETHAGPMARCWLPALDGKNQPIPFERLDSRDIADTITTARRKSIAMARGTGLGVYCKSGPTTSFTNGIDFVNEVGVAPEHDLSVIEPRIGMAERRPYLEWPVALAAARITDPLFRWEVLEFESADENGEIGQQPYLRVPGGYLVTVRVTYKGAEHEETLAITRSENRINAQGKSYVMHNVPAKENLTAAEWNTAVMRCLAKAVAMATGYGLSIYARASMEEMAAMIGSDRSEPAAPASPTPPQAASSESEDQEARKEAIAKIEALLVSTGTDRNVVLGHYGVESFEAAAAETLGKVVQQLNAKARRLQAKAQTLPSPQPSPAPAG